MKQISLILTALLLILSGCNNSNDAQADINLDSHDKRISYLLGMDSGKNIQSTGIDVDREAFQQGLNDGLSNVEPKLTEAEIAEAIQVFQAQVIANREEMQKVEQQAFELLAKKNLEEGAVFLKENAQKEGIVTTETGLQYKVLTAGSGPMPTLESVVEVHYAGRLLDNTEFDSSIKRGEPVQFGVTQVIPGWTEALQLMSEGAKWELYIPSGLGYGAGGQGQIGPNATLIFEVELLKANVKSDAN